MQALLWTLLVALPALQLLLARCSVLLVLPVHFAPAFLRVVFQRVKL
jgi:hypothetical protein